MKRLQVETLALETRRSVLWRLREYLDAGYRDLEMLYWGGRFALSLGLRGEALKFLRPLATLLTGSASPDVEGPGGSWFIVTNPESPASAFAPVALLLLAALGEDDPAAGHVLQQLRALAEKESSIATEPVVADAVDPNSTETIAGILRKMVEGGELDWTPRMPSPIESATEARTKYNLDQIDEARAALETALGGQIDELAVLANLVIVTSEQHDIEAYERYWRRLVRLALFRMLRRDRAMEAKEALKGFYVRVAEATEQQCGGKANEVVELLRRPGFLARWLESHSALVWLDAFDREGVHQKTRLGPGAGAGRLGELSLFRAWTEIFYPEFSAFIVPPSEYHGATTLLTAPGFKSALPFEPGRRLLSRMLEWSQYQFGIREREERHAETVCAFAILVARLPKSRHLRELAKTTRPEICRDRTIDRAVREACSLPFRVRLSRYLGKEDRDWEGLVRLLPDPDLRAGLTAELQLFSALGMVELGRRSEGMEAACLAMEHFDDDELAKDSQARVLLSNVIRAAIGGVVDDEKVDTASRLTEMHDRVRQVPNTGSAGELRTEVLEQIRSVKEQIALNERIDRVMKQTEQHMGKQEFDQAIAVVRGLPDEPSQVVRFKKNLLSQIEEAKISYLLNQKLELAMDQIKRHMGQQEFDQAIVVVHRLPDEPSQVAELKKNLLSQIEESKGSYLLNQRIDAVMTAVQGHVVRGYFQAARKEVHRLPDGPPQVTKLKRDILGQIDGAEAQRSEMMGESDALLRRLRRRGLDINAIHRIGRDNNIDSRDPMQLYGLLKALERQL